MRANAFQPHTLPIHLPRVRCCRLLPFAYICTVIGASADKCCTAPKMPKEKATRKTKAKAVSDGGKKKKGTGFFGRLPL